MTMSLYGRIVYTGIVLTTAGSFVAGCATSALQQETQQLEQIAKTISMLRSEIIGLTAEVELVDQNLKKTYQDFKEFP